MKNDPEEVLRSVWGFFQLVTRSLNLIVTEIDRSICRQQLRQVLHANDREFAIKVLVYINSAMEISSFYILTCPENNIKLYFTFLHTGYNCYGDVMSLHPTGRHSGGQLIIKCSRFCVPMLLIEHF